MSEPSASLSHGECQPVTLKHAISANDIDFVMSIFARGEAGKLIRGRMVVRDLKDRSKRHKYVSRVFDIEADIERSLLLLESLPQPSRGAYPPCHEFLILAKAVSGEIAQPECILERAVLFEEYALQLVNAYTTLKQSGVGGTAPGPWLVLSGVFGGLPAPCEAMLSWADKWMVDQMRRFLGAVRFRDEHGNLRHVNRSERHRRQKGQNVHRRRKRHRKHSTLSDAVSAGEKPRDEDTCGSHSSDYYTECYTDSSDDEQGRYRLENRTG